MKTMTSLTTLLSNDDVAPRIPLLIKTMEKPSTETLQKAIHALSQTTFVAIVTSPVLALLTPLLERSLNTPTTSQEVLRQTVVVVENLTKLVHDPIEARTFLPKLKPGVQGVKDRASLPEVRELATRAINVIKKAMKDDDGNVVEGSTKAHQLRKTCCEILGERGQGSNGGLVVPDEDAELWSLTKVYISDMVKEDVNHAPHRQEFPANTITIPSARFDAGRGGHRLLQVTRDISTLRKTIRKFGQPIKPLDGEVEIVNTDFSLAYGGMLLLSHTNITLHKGHRYGLCGRNGAGKVPH